MQPLWLSLLQPTVTFFGFVLVVVGWRITLRLQRQKIAIEFLQRMTDQELWLKNERMVSRRILDDRQNPPPSDTWLTIVQKRYEPAKYAPPTPLEIELGQALNFVLAGYEFIGSVLHKRAVDGDILYEHVSARAASICTARLPMIEYVRNYYKDPKIYENFERMTMEWQARDRS